MPKGVYIRTEEQKRKISKSCKGHPNYNVMLKGCFKKGHKNSPETRRKISESLKGKPSCNKGRKHSDETRRKNSEAHRGEKSPLWQGGKSFEKYGLDWIPTLKRSMRERDKYTCQICNQYGNFVHHIDYDKKNCDPKNLITLCRRCHQKTNFRRDYWIKFFNEKNNN